MKRYQDTKPSGIEWIGDIPWNWKITKLKFVTRQIIDGTHVTPNYTNDGIPFLRVTDIQNSEIDLSTVKKISLEEHLNLTKRCNPEPGDVLLSKNGTIGVTKVVDWDWEFSIFVSLCLIKFQSNLNPKYFSHFFNSNVVDQQIHENTKKTSVLNLHLEKIKELLITLPPMQEQHDIASFLDRKTQQIDDLISKKRRLIQLLEEEKTAVINRAVTKGLDPDVPMRESGIPWLGKIPAHWKVGRLKRYVETNPLKSEKNHLKESSELVTFLPMENVSECGDFDNTLQKSISSLWNGYTYFEEMDVIFAKITPCFENGKAALLKNLGSKIGFGSTEFHVLRATGLILPDFLLYLVKTEYFREVGKSYMQGVAGQKRVTSAFLDELKIALPDTDEQLKICTYLENCFKKIEISKKSITKEIELLLEYRIALINEAVTGKIDVREEEGNRL